MSNKKTTFCPKCGERMRGIRHHEDYGWKCPRAACGYFIQDFSLYKKVEPKSRAVQMSLFNHENDGLPF